ncbi:DEAD/DEAH box helicase [Enterococcus plantarum]|uniref:DEAD/DEAH box helicase n=1 Tax=Enterococcus plantarum TaxID=1077675 RepID=UPI001A8ECC2B|nr:DEAD/DEAH box helicase [Enterococcus plantarum]MBO0423334.1 SNF2 helicase associated domain-containing protein [Enterococcus plantarum]
MKWSIPERIVERGREYMKEGRVLSVIQDPEKKIWHAEVLGNELYRVQLDGTAKENDICECPYWKDHGYCKHTVAVELYLRQKGTSRIIKADQPITFEKRSLSISEMFTKGFAKLNQVEEKSKITPLTVEYIVDVIETNSYYPELAVLGVSLRLGNQGVKPKTYIIKNIGEFFQTFQKEGSFLINKQHRFDLVKDAFSVENQELLQQLSAIYQTSQLLGANGIQVKGKIDKRYLVLPIDQGQKLLEKMSLIPHFQLNDEGKKYRHLSFVKGALPIFFDISKQLDNQYKLLIDDQITTFLSHYQWGFSKDQVYIFTQEQEAIYTTLLQLLKRVEKPEIIYEKPELSDLFGGVIPLLKKIGTVNVTEEVTEEVVYHPLEPIFIFRKIKGMIKVRVDFTYGKVVFSTEKAYSVASGENQEVVRDGKKEQEIIEQLMAFGYQKTTDGYEKTLPAGERLYYFFKAEVPTFRHLGEVRMGKKLRELYLDAAHHQPLIEVSDSDSWLDVRFDITGIAEQEIDEVLASLLRNDRFYTLETGEVLSLDSEEFQQTSEVLTLLRKNMKNVQGTIQVPRNQGLMIESMLENNTQAHFSDSFKEMVANLTHPEKFDAVLPEKINATLRSYQIDGYKWLKMLSYYQFGGILADEMGLGKTLQTITYLLSEKEEQKQTGAALIVAPASLIYNWAAELKKFAPDLQAEVVAGNKSERERLANQADLDVLITSYASLRQDIDMYQGLNLGYLILDEAQMVKNSGTKTAQALKSLTVPQRFALSGTPIENNLDELWSIFQMIIPGLFPSKTLFRSMKPEEIARIIQPFILRRDKKTVLADLPDKIESNLYSVLTEEQKTVYLAYLKQMQENVSQMDQDAFKKNRLSILAGLTRLRQICCDPSLFIDDYTGGSGKLEQVKDLLVAAKENNRRVLLFSQFTSMLSIIEKELHDLDLSTFYLRGSTKPKERMEMADAFNAGEKDVFLISLKAGGTGLNLTGADTVILYDLWWNPAVEEQAAGRAHRIGQKNVVEVWRMIAEGTVEEKMNSLQQEKRELFQKVIQGNEEQLAKMTEEDIRMILSIGE